MKYPSVSDVYIGDVMECIHADNCRALTPGKEYIVRNWTLAGYSIRIKNDEGNLRYYPAVRFMLKRRSKENVRSR